MKHDEYAHRNGIANGGFTSDDIVDLKRLVARLKADHPVSRKLLEHLSAKCRNALEQFFGSDADQKVLLPLLVDDFNRLIGGESLFKPDEFRQVRLRRHTRKLLKKNPSGTKLVAANRLLLQDYFPVELRRAPARGKAAVQEHPSVHFETAIDRWAVYVTLVEPREINGKMRSRFCRWVRTTRAAADAKCSQVDAQIFGQELARQLSDQEIALAKEFFWKLLEPKHEDWKNIQCLAALISHAEEIEWKPPGHNVPTILEAAKVFWREHVSALTRDTRLNYRAFFGYLLAKFGHLYP